MFLCNSTQRTTLQGKSYGKEESLVPSLPLPFLYVSNTNAYPIRETSVKIYDIDISDTNYYYSQRERWDMICPSSNNHSSSLSSKIVDINFDLPIVLKTHFITLCHILHYLLVIIYSYLLSPLFQFLDASRRGLLQLLALRPLYVRITICFLQNFKTFGCAFMVIFLVLIKKRVE